MKVSVCVITYNHERYLAQALDSVLAQRVDFPYEIVVAEDCSTDGTRRVVEDYARRYPGVVRPVLHERNVGVQQNFLDAFGLCRGEYVALLEGDDYWTAPDKLARQAALLDADPSCTICYHPVDVRHEDGSTPPRRHPAPGHRPVRTLDQLLRASGLPLQTCSVMLRRSAVPELPEWFLRMPSGDWPLFVLCAQAGGIAWIEETMAVYRIHGGGLWSRAPQPERVARATEMNRTLQQHLGPAYHRAMESRLAANYANMALALCAAEDRPGARAEARRFAGRAFASWVRARRFNARLALKMLARVYAPGVTNRLRGGKRNAVGPGGPGLSEPRP